MQLQKEIKAISGMGEIIIRVYRKGRPVSAPNHENLTVKDAIGEVAEKALKGKTLSHETW